MAAIWTARILTLFPDIFPGPLAASLSGRGLERGKWELEAVNIRDFANDRHHSVDGPPAGGGPGMVMRADIVGRAVDALWPGEESGGPLIYMSPRGRPLDQKMARSLAAGPGVTLICGRFEGLDQRLLEARPVREVSIGDYVLSGGELAAMVLIDACVRLLPGIVGSDLSLASESHEQGLLEYPQYTRPRQWEGRDIPPVLLSGDHARVREWRQKKAEELTRRRRPDMWEAWRQGEGREEGRKEKD